ncbi:hypothetical protein [Roseivirga sp.]|uniref:hypothetical protein n=1 Tax=Roseivirga sp. TaxID=1964215 RepID=UPI003B8E4CBE
MKILLVSSSILPQTGGSSVIVENLAQNFERTEFVVFGSSTWNPRKVPGRNPDGPKFIYFFTEMYFMGRGNRFFRWFRKLRFNQLVTSIEKVIKEQKIDHVIGVFPNIDYCRAACIAAKRTACPFSSYFHNTYIENRSIKDARAADWQQGIFDQSEQVFVMSKGMQVYYEKEYRSDKFIPLVHTFNEYPLPEGQTGIPGANKDVYNLVAIGNFNESNLEASKRMLNAIGSSNKFTLSIYTHVPKLLLEKRGMDPALFNYKGAVRPEEVNEVIQQYDVCVLTHGFEGGYGEIEYQTIFPTRTIPLLLSGKPIFVHSPKGSFLNNFIQENACAHLVDTANASAIIAGLNKVVQDEQYQKKLVENAAETVKLFYGPHVAARLKEQLKISV